MCWQFWQWVPGRACNRSWGGAQLRASGDVIEWICQYFHIGFAGCITAAAQRTKQFDRFRRILLKNSNFGLDHNLEDCWQPQWKFA